MRWADEIGRILRQALRSALRRRRSLVLWTAFFAGSFSGQGDAQEVPDAPVRLGPNLTLPANEPPATESTVISPPSRTEVNRLPVQPQNPVRSPHFQFPAPPQLPMGQGGVLTPFRHPTNPQLRTVPLDYWIISSRNCNQFGQPSNIQACVQFYRQQTQTPIQRRPGQEFFDWLEPGVPVVVVVHGSLVDWNVVQDDSRETYLWLREALPETRVKFVFYTWPSDRMLIFAPFDYSVLGKRSAYNSLYLGQLLERFPKETPICFMGHSHGARVVVSTLHLLGGGEIHSQRLPTIPKPLPRIRAILAAAAVDRHWLSTDERYSEAAKATERIVNLRNTNDLALMMYPLRRPFGGESLGRVGVLPQEYYARTDTVKKIQDYDIARLIGTGHTWPHYYAQPRLAKFIAPIAFFQDDKANSVDIPPIAPPEDLGNSPDLEGPTLDIRSQTPAELSPISNRKSRAGSRVKIPEDEGTQAIPDKVPSAVQIRRQRGR